MPRQFSAPAAFSDKPYTAIPLTPVQSNQVGAVGYDAATKTLAVQFSRGAGAIYHYPDVDQKVYDDFMAAESKGTFFGQHIKALPFDKFPAPAGLPAAAAPAPAAPAITPATIAAKLHGMEYPLRDIKAIAAEAKAAGIVIVYGASDDLMEFDGAFRDEVGAEDGTTALFDAKGALPDWENIESEEASADYHARKPMAREIEAVWCPKDDDGKVYASWAYKTAIPHVTFDVMEDGDLYCRGIVFALADLAKTPA